MNEYEMHDTLGQYLRNLRIGARLTQTDLAKKVRPGIDGHKFISRVENNQQQPSEEDLSNIALTLSCEKNELLGAAKYFSQTGDADNQVDLRPLLVKLGQSTELVTFQKRSCTIKHFILLARAGGV